MSFSTGRKSLWDWSLIDRQTLLRGITIKICCVAVMVKGERSIELSLTHTFNETQRSDRYYPHCYNGGVVKKKLTEWWLSFLPLHYNSWTSVEIEVHPIRVALLFLNVDVPVYFLFLSLFIFLHRFHLFCSLKASVSLFPSVSELFLLFSSVFSRSIAISPLMEWKGHHASYTETDTHKQPY